MLKPRKFVAVIGASRATPEELSLAEQVGKELAENGFGLICGGLSGVMEAASKGAYNNGGTTIGILPGEFREEANPYVQIPIVTGIGYARNSIVAKSASAVIAIGGGYGTLSEVAYARQANLPVIGLGTWAISKNGNQDSSIFYVNSAEEAVSKVISLIGN